MKQNKLYGLILALSVLIFSACNDTKENPAAADGPYSFFNATTPLTITQNTTESTVSTDGSCSTGTCGVSCSTSTCFESSGGTFVEANSTNISVQLLKYGLAEPGQVVQMLPFDYKYGSLVNTVVTTDENGRAVFEYVAPEGNDYNAIRGSIITIQAVFEKPIEEGDNVYVDADAPPVIIMTQDFLLQFR